MTGVSTDSTCEIVERRLRDRGITKATTDAVVHMMRALTAKEGVDWETVSGPHLLRLCDTALRRDRLRMGLLAMRTDARRRWPAVFARHGARPLRGGDDPKRPTLENTMPAPILSRDPTTDPIRQLFHQLYEKLIERGEMTTILSFRVVLSFLHGFLFSTPASLLPDEVVANLSTDEVLTRLRSFTHSDIVLAYDGYRLFSCQPPPLSLSLSPCPDANSLRTVSPPRDDSSAKGPPQPRCVGICRSFRCCFVT